MVFHEIFVFMKKQNTTFVCEKIREEKKDIDVTVPRGANGDVPGFIATQSNALTNSPPIRSGDWKDCLIASQRSVEKGQVGRYS
jgi:hypothetical protein